MSLQDQLQKDLRDIFKLKKSTFDQPGESLEQETLFIEVETCRTRLKEGIETGRVNGKVRIFAQNDKLPLGYLAKRIEEASATLLNRFFFSELEENSNTYRNLAERNASFVYFYSSQYNPPSGTITSVEFNEVTT